MRVYSLTLRNRVVATLVVLGMIGLGTAVLFVGFAVLAALAATGAVIGTGAAIYNRLRGRSVESQHVIRDAQLDPSLEVFPTRRAISDAIETRRDTPES